MWVRGWVLHLYQRLSICPSPFNVTSLCSCGSHFLLLDMEPDLSVSACILLVLNSFLGFQCFVSYGDNNHTVLHCCKAHAKIKKNGKFNHL